MQLPNARPPHCSTLEHNRGRSIAPAWTAVSAKDCSQRGGLQEAYFLCGRGQKVGLALLHSLLSSHSRVSTVTVRRLPICSPWVPANVASCCKYSSCFACKATSTSQSTLFAKRSTCQMPSPTYWVSSLSVTPG
eukprot:2606665-Amphidinium_carterae.2